MTFQRATAWQPWCAPSSACHRRPSSASTHPFGPTGLAESARVALTTNQYYRFIMLLWHSWAFVALIGLRRDCIPSWLNAPSSAPPCWASAHLYRTTINACHMALRVPHAWHCHRIRHLSLSHCVLLRLRSPPWCLATASSSEGMARSCWISHQLGSLCNRTPGGRQLYRSPLRPSRSRHRTVFIHQASSH